MNIVNPLAIWFLMIFSSRRFAELIECVDLKIVVASL